MPTSDLHSFVNAFGVPLIFTLSDGSTLQFYDTDKPIKGIFDSSYTDANLGNMIIETDSPMITCVGADVATVQEYDKVLIGSDNYNISKKRPTGDGMTIFELEKLSAEETEEENP